jgi:hypothetical protein
LYIIRNIVTGQGNYDINYPENVPEYAEECVISINQLSFPCPKNGGQ